MSAARARPPVPPPSRRARPPHLPPSFARLHDCVRPPLHLLAVPVIRTRTVLLAVSAILSTCPLARPSTFSQCPSPALAPSFQPCLYLQHVPVRPPLYLLAVPVTRTCPVLLAVSVSSARAHPPAPLPPRSARHPHSHPSPAASTPRARRLACLPRVPVRPTPVVLAVPVPRTRTRTAPRLQHAPACQYRLAVPTRPRQSDCDRHLCRACIASPTMRPPPDRPHCACVSPVTRLLSTGTAYSWRLCHVIASST